MSEELSHSIIRKQPIEKWAEDLKRFDIQWKILRWQKICMYEYMVVISSLLPIKMA
jgi:hypothetical protein